MRISWLVVLVLFFYGCKKEPQYQQRFGVHGQINFELETTNHKVLENEHKDNLFLKSIEENENKDKYLDCIVKLKIFNNFPSECRDLYRDSIKNCFLNHQFNSCAILRNLSSLYHNKDMVSKVDSEVSKNHTDHSEIYNANKKLLYTSNISKPMQVTLRSGISTDTNKPYIGYSIHKELGSGDIFAFTYTAHSDGGMINHKYLNGNKMYGFYWGQRYYINRQVGFYVGHNSSVKKGKSKNDKTLMYSYTLNNIGLTYSPFDRVVLMSGIGLSIESDIPMYDLEDYDYNINFNSEMIFSLYKGWGIIFGYNSIPQAYNIGLSLVF